MMKRIASLFMGISVFGFIGSAMAAPDVTNSTWTASLGAFSTMTISGTAFGATKPTVAIYESFENGTLGNGMPNGTSASYVGHWSTPTASGNGPKYSNVEKYSGSQSMVVDMSLGSDGGDFYNLIDLSSTTKFLICEDWKLTGNWPGYGVSGSNMKFDWVQWNLSTTNTDLYPGFGVSGSNIPSSSYLDSNDSTNYGDHPPYTLGASLSTTSAPSGSPLGWHHFCLGIDGVGGAVRFYDKPDVGAWHLNRSTDLAIPILLDTNMQHTYWTLITEPGYGRVSVGVRWYKDNIYVATGTAAFAEAYLTDQASITTSNELIPLKVITWSDTQITAMIPTNNLTAGSAYVVICDASFNCDPTGFRIDYGQTSGNTPASLTGRPQTISGFSGVDDTP